MGIGLSIRVAPGVRLRASSRGIRASVGPRAARVHVGAGRTVVSTGFGPFTASSALSSSRQGGRPHRQPTLRDLQRQARAQELADVITRVQRLEQAITSLHHETFPPGSRAIITAEPDPSSQNRKDVRRRFTRTATAGLSWLDRTERAKRRALAEQQADDFFRLRNIAGTVRVQRSQLDEDERWSKLEDHDPFTVITAVDDAFADNASESTCIDAGRHGETGSRFVTCVVLFGTPDMVPERKPAVTPGGKPTFHKRSKTEINQVYLKAMASTVLATAKEALAVAVSADEAYVIVLQEAHPTARPMPIYVGGFLRRQFDATDWARVDPAELIQRTDGAQLVLKGVSKAVSPLKGYESLERIAAAFATHELG